MVMSDCSFKSLEESYFNFLFSLISVGHHDATV